MTINEIVNGNYKVTEKQETLETYQQHILNEIEQAKQDIVNGYKYCPKCREYYKEKTWEIKHKIEKRNKCVYRDTGYGDNDQYADCTCSVHYGLCPVGHFIEEKIVWL